MSAGAAKVLINAVHAKSGGGVTYLANILPLLAARADLAVELAIQADQVDTIRPLAGTIPLHVLPKVGKLATVYWQEQVTIPRLAARIGAALVFSPANYGPLAGRNVLMLRNAFEVAALETRWDKKLYWLAVRLTTEWSFRRAKAAIAVSRIAADNFLKSFAMKDDGRIRVVHHGVSTLFSPPADDASRRPGRLLAVSDIYVQKNFETLLQALALLAPDHPDLTLEIAGRPLDPGYLDRLHALVGQLGLGGRVSFLGGKTQPELAELYRQADIFVFPSLVETFGNPLLEAMASGLPVVCSNAAALPEVAGQAALYARPGDAADMAAGIARLLSDRALWARQSAAGTLRAQAFTWQRCADATAALLLDVARG